MERRNVNEMELLSDWFEEMSNPQQFEEPILEDYAVQFLQFACDHFHLDVHVLITSVYIIEQYLRRKEDETTVPFDESLMVVACLFISSKFIRGKNKLRCEDAIEFLESETFSDYETETFLETEREILRVIGFSIPLTTVVDDLSTLSQLYLEKHNINVNIVPLCNEILQMIYVRRKEWYNELKNFYSQNEEGTLFFEFLITNRLYIPAAVLLACWYITDLKNYWDITTAVNNLTQITKIQRDHLNLAAGVVMNYLKKQT